MTSITVTLLNWKRPENLPILLDSLFSQTIKPRVILWNNEQPFHDDRLDLIINSSKNLKCWPRWLMASMTDTEYVCSLDDDLALKDDKVLEDLVSVMDKDNVVDRVYGLEGVILNPGLSYRRSHPPRPEPLAPVDIVKGRMMALHRTALSSLNMLHGVTVADDIAISGLMARGRLKYHRVVGWLRNRVQELPAPNALCFMPDHYSRRDIAARQYFYR